MARRLFGVVAAIALASGAMFALVGPASAQVTSTLTILKNVSGVVPSGTVFAVQVSCTSAPSSQTVWFDETGHASDSTGHQISGNVIDVGATNTCTVSETYSGGASSITYACAEGSDSPDTNCTQDNQVEYTGASGNSATITVTNTFETTTTSTTTTTLAPAVTTLPPVTTTTLAPKPAPVPVVAPAHFTG